jgi:hypothetical protein
MIFVDNTGVGGALPSGWQSRAVGVLQELESAAPEARSAIIAANDELWRELKPVLATMAAYKCWYCGSRNDRSDNAVDHYRPKGKLLEAPEHGGYWWLAFDSENYRYSCTFCNSRRVDVAHGTAGGKQSHFPLASEATRAREPADSLMDEQPMLLDPCRLGDVCLLWFDDSGATTVNPQSADDLDKRRVEMSCDIYHLDHHLAVAARRKIYHDVTRLVRAADRAFAAHNAGSPEARDLYESLLLQLRGLLSAEAEHTAVARCAAQGFRASSGAIQAVLASL